MIEKQFPKKRVKFYKRAHRYVLDKDVELCSVTTWIKSFFTPFNEMSAACATAASRRKKGIETTAHQVMKEWAKSRTDGTKIHKEAENFVNGKSKPESDKGKVSQKFVEILKDQGYELFPEQLIYDGELGLAGTADLIAVAPDGNLVVCDWKTNNRIYQTAFGDKKGSGACASVPDCNYWHYYLQLSTYAYLLSLKGYHIKECVLVHLQKESYEPYTIIPAYEIVQEMLNQRNGHDMVKAKKAKIEEETI